MKKLLLALSMLTGVLVTPAVGTEYYVSTGGNDANNGTSRETAFATIAHAVDVAADGDAVCVLAGTYEVSAAISMTEAITIVGDTDNPADVVVRNTAGTVTKTSGSNTDTAHRVFVINNADAILSGIVAEDGRAGAWVKNGTISWCCITNNIGGQHNTYGCGISFSGGQGTVDHCIISDNNATGGASFYGGGIGGVGTVGPVTIDSCLIVNNLLGASGAGGGIGIKNLGGDCIVRNCTVVGNTANTHSAGIRIENRTAGNSTAVGVVINTIAAGNMKSGAEVNYADNYVVDKTNSSNCFFGLADEAALFADSLSGEPKFVAAANGDYRLSGESAAKNAGVAYSGIGVDLEGVAFAAAPSIGCYEYDPNALPPPDPTEWDISGTNGGIKALDDGHGGKCVTFTAIERVGSDVAVVFQVAEIGAPVGASFGLVCKDNLADTETFTLNAELTVVDATNVLGTLETQTNKTQLFVVGIGSVAE